MTFDYAKLVAYFAAATRSTTYTLHGPSGHQVLQPQEDDEILVLNIVGQDGWELVSVTADPLPGQGFETTYWLKRAQR